MIERIKLDKSKKISDADLRRIVSVLQKGDVVVLPTDTSYGLAGLVSKPKAVKKVFDIKGRPTKKTVSFVVRSMAQAKEYGRISCKPTKVWKEFLPGPLTLVVEAKDKGKNIPMITRKEDNSVAVRYIDTPVVMQILRKLDAPLTITSANVSDKPDIYSFEEFERQHKKNKHQAKFFVDAGKLEKNKPSTIVSFIDGVQVLRSGKISKNDIIKSYAKAT